MTGRRSGRPQCAAGVSRQVQPQMVWCHPGHPGKREPRTPTRGVDRRGNPLSSGPSGVPRAEGACHGPVLGALRGRDRWLLVFDNAKDPTALDRSLPGGAGHVLITSRNPSGGERQSSEVNAVQPRVRASYPTSKVALTDLRGNPR